MADDIIPPEDMSNFDKAVQSLRTLRDTVGAGIQRGVDNASTGIRRAWDTLTVPGYGQDPTSAAADLQRQGKFQGSVFNQEYLKELKADPEFQKRQLDRATNIVLNTGAPGAFNLTTKTLERLPNKPRLNADTILQQLQRQDVSKPEKEILTKALEDRPNVDTARFKERVQADLLPLEVKKSDTYADYGLENLGAEMAGNPTPDELGAKTHIWKMPETEAHDFKHHFIGETGTMDGRQTYFAHTRRYDSVEPSGKPWIEEPMPPKVRNITEIQSDLFQRAKGDHLDPDIRGDMESDLHHLKRLQAEIRSGKSISKNHTFSYLADALGYPKSRIASIEKNPLDWVDEIVESGKLDAKISELQKALDVKGLLPGRSKALEKTWYQRTIREENRLAAQEGITTVRVPVGETAAKVEGWPVADFYHSPEIKGIETEGTINTGAREEKAKYTGNISNEGTDEVKLEMVTPSGKKRWTNVFDLEDSRLMDLTNRALDEGNPVRSGFFPEHQGIHDFYEKDVRKFVAKEYGAKEITDKNGHKWMEWKVDPKAKDRPVQALTAGAPGTDVSDDKIDLSPIDPHIETLRKIRNGGSARSR